MMNRSVLLLLDPVVAVVAVAVGSTVGLWAGACVLVAVAVVPAIGVALAAMGVSVGAAGADVGVGVGVACCMGGTDVAVGGGLTGVLMGWLAGPGYCEASFFTAS